MDVTSPLNLPRRGRIQLTAPSRRKCCNNMGVLMSEAEVVVRLIEINK